MTPAKVLKLVLVVACGLAAVAAASFYIKNYFEYGFSYNFVSATNLIAPSLVATAKSSTEISLSWNDPNTSETGYVVERSLQSDSGFTQVTKTSKNATSFLDSGLAQATYHYRVKATGKNNTSSSYSNVASTAPLSTTTTTPPLPTASSSSTSLPSTTGMLRRNVWLWQSGTATDATQRATFFQFADAHAIRTIYFESESLIQNNQQALASFISEAKNHNMGVELLFGDSAWARTANQNYAVSLAQKAVAFASTASVKPEGVHYDVEPYTLTEWSSTSTSNDIANQYLDLLEKLNSATQGTSLKLSVDVPFWYDTCSKCTITRNGQTLNMSNAVIDRVNNVTLMDYSDTASLIISRASGEISYAKSVGKTATIGVNTASSSEGGSTTFYEEGNAVMEQALAAVSNYYSTNAGFSGLAVHDYIGYSQLKP